MFLSTGRGRHVPAPSGRDVGSNAAAPTQEPALSRYPLYAVRFNLDFAYKRTSAWWFSSCSSPSFSSSLCKPRVFTSNLRLHASAHWMLYFRDVRGGVARVCFRVHGHMYHLRPPLRWPCLFAWFSSSSSSFGSCDLFLSGAGIPSDSLDSQPRCLFLRLFLHLSYPLCGAEWNAVLLLLQCSNHCCLLSGAQCFHTKRADFTGVKVEGLFKGGHYSCCLTCFVCASGFAERIS